jgi:hypothetical protein
MPVEQLIDDYLDMNPNEANGAELIEFLRRAGFSIVRAED